MISIIMFTVNILIFLIALLTAAGICRSQELQTKQEEEEITSEEASCAATGGLVRTFSPPPLLLISQRRNGKQIFI